MYGYSIERGDDNTAHVFHILPPCKFDRQHIPI
jgi:hypothetical protein